jgi:hypothetical protein
MRVTGTLAALLAIASGTSVATPRTTPSQPPACSSSSLKIFATGRHPGDTEDLGALIVFASKSAKAKPCSLTGRPNATAETSTGRVVKLLPWTGPLTDAGHAVVTVTQPAYLVFFDIEECSVVNQGPPFYVEITVRIGRQERRVTGLGNVPDRCGPLGESSYINY